MIQGEEEKVGFKCSCYMTTEIRELELLGLGLGFGEGRGGKERKKKKRW